jgi:hypothetical protein
MTNFLKSQPAVKEILIISEKCIGGRKGLA